MLFKPGVSLSPGAPLTARLSFLSTSVATTTAWFCGIVTTPAQARLASTGTPLMDVPASAEIFMSILRATSPERITDGVALRVKPRSSYCTMGMLGTAPLPREPSREERAPELPAEFSPGIFRLLAPTLENEDVSMG